MAWSSLGREWKSTDALFHPLAHSLHAISKNCWLAGDSQKPFSCRQFGDPRGTTKFWVQHGYVDWLFWACNNPFFFFFIPQQHKIYCTCTLFLHTRGTPGAPWSCQTCIGKCYPHRPAGHQLLHSLRKVEHRSVVPLCAQKDSSNLAADGNLPTSPSSRQLREKES